MTTIRLVVSKLSCTWLQNKKTRKRVKFVVFFSFTFSFFLSFFDFFCLFGGWVGDLWGVGGKGICGRGSLGCGV